MLKVRIKMKDRNKTEMSERIQKKCMHVHCTCNYTYDLSS